MESSQWHSGISETVATPTISISLGHGQSVEGWSEEEGVYL